MNIKSIFSDDDAVSPVIGVILMVAITVILAAVIGAFVLGIGSSQETVPSASWEWTNDSDYTAADVQCGVVGDGTPNAAVAVEHKGGDQLDSSNLVLGGEDCGGSTDIGAGTTLGVNEVGVDSTVNLVWNSPSSDSTNVLSSFDV